MQAADDFGEAEAEARLAGYEALARGADRARSTVKLTGRESPDGQAGFTRCARATFTASYMYRCCAYRGSAVSAPDST